MLIIVCCGAGEEIERSSLDLELFLHRAIVKTPRCVALRVHYNATQP